MTRQSSVMDDSIFLDQFLKVANYEDTVRQLDIYYGIGALRHEIIYLRSWVTNDYVLVKRQLLRYQSPITGLFPVLSSDTEIGSVRESVYCAAAVWGLYQSYR